MPRKSIANDVIKQANEVVLGWNQIGPTVAFGTLTLVQLTNEVNAFIALDAEIGRVEKLLAEKNNLRDALALALWEKVKRSRASVKGLYGDDSTQYELVGGTRMSERKRRTRKVIVTE